ncbi:hypothetical protein AX774_g488 [Zancudomyces culisetae]|uniref:Uncharacterized protein n=1 Tax=Zancudomyces culisetae TaxID=1213189 RepID=A0A1R1PYA5_ZANCU|nr:hypothetical protein AX774_g488 [Zancudomyces culisetae]|eukprot:OMH85946.1 hypothetical protein AX774_g488 [Zancudomyces culisetae]
MNREDTSDGEQDSFEDSEDESLEDEEEENGYYPTGGSSFESGKKGGYVGDTSYGNYDSTGMGVFEYLRNGVGDGGSTKPVKMQLSKPVESKSGKLYVFEDDTGERVEVRCNRCYKEDFGDIEDFMKHSDKVHGVKYNDKQEVINECGIYEVM